MAMFLAVRLFKLLVRPQIYHRIICFMNILKPISNARCFVELFSVTIQAIFFYIPIQVWLCYLEVISFTPFLQIRNPRK